MRASRACWPCSDFTRREIAALLPRPRPRASCTSPWAPTTTCRRRPPRDEARARLGVRGPAGPHRGRHLQPPLPARAAARRRAACARACPDLRPRRRGREPDASRRSTSPALGGAPGPGAARARSPASSSDAGAGRPLRRRRRGGLPLRVRGLRPARAGGHGARRARRGQRPARAGRDLRRGRAAGGPARRRRRSRPPSTACSRDRALRADLVARGRALAARYSWAETAPPDPRGARRRRPRDERERDAARLGRRSSPSTPATTCCAAWPRSGARAAAARGRRGGQRQRRRLGRRGARAPSRDVRRDRERRRTSASRAANNRGLRAARGALRAAPQQRRRGAAGRRGGAGGASWTTRADVGIVGPRTVGRRRHAPRSRSGPPSRRSREWRQRRLVRGVRGATPEALRERRALGRARARAGLGLRLLPPGPARRARGGGRLRRGLLPLRRGRRPVPARCARRAGASLFTPRPRSSTTWAAAWPGRRTRARARVPPQPPPLLPQAHGARWPRRSCAALPGSPRAARLAARPGPRPRRRGSAAPLGDRLRLRSAARAARCGSSRRRVTLRATFRVSPSATRSGYGDAYSAAAWP